MNHCMDCWIKQQNEWLNGSLNESLNKENCWMNIESTLNKHELFPPTWSTPEAGMIFPLCRVSHRWMESTASFLDVLHTNVRYLRKKKIYCRTAYSEGDTSTADLLLGVSTTTGSDKPWCSILDCDSISARTKVRSAGISHAICFWFPTALPECPTGGLGLLGKCKNFWNCLHKMYWMKLVVQEMWKCTKGSLKLFNLLGLFLHC